MDLVSSTSIGARPVTLIAFSRVRMPADQPVQAPTKYQLVINQKTAKALAITVPQSAFARADELID